MWPWASLWVAQLAVGMFVWPIVYRGGLGSWAMAVVAGAFFGSIAYALYASREAFAPRALRLRERYGDWALITGASSGLGREFARALAAEGISCVLVARRSERLEDLARELGAAHGISTRVLSVDLAEATGQARVAESVADLSIGILVNNAGFGLAGSIVKQDPARLREMVELNCHAPVALTRALLPSMIARARGAIIVVGSVAGRQAVPLFSTYSATKSFDLIFGEALWGELRDHNIDVTVLQPGPVATEFEQAAGEARTDRRLEEAPNRCVRYALEALGRQPSVVSGGWPTWIVANVSRFLPRWLVTLVAGTMYEQQTPRELR
jgi:short-subunit dehydrogenase